MTMDKKIKQILEKELLQIKPSEKEENEIREMIGEFLLSLNKKLKKYGKAVIGGSFAKGTTIKKKKYDVDIFVLFKDEKKNISDMLEKVLKHMKIKAERLPGSRDYFSISMKAGGIPFKTEVVPVVKIKNSGEAKNVTDVSMLHVNYISGKIEKNPKLGDEIRLAKAFCYGQGCYGAESHIKGFSGYCLEILASHYRSFLNLMRNAAKWKGKVILDPEKHYKNKDEILNEINEAKLLSPLILIDPVQKNRNAAAALDREKFDAFVEAAKRFMKNPASHFFERKELDEGMMIKEAKKRRFSLWKADAESRKIKEDISGAKLLKLHKVLALGLKKEGYIVEDRWIFSDKKAISYFMTKKPSVFVQKGPPAAMKKHADEFRKRWKNAFVKEGTLYVEREPKKIDEILRLDKKIMKDMGIDSFKVKRVL